MPLRSEEDKKRVGPGEVSLARLSRVPLRVPPPSPLAQGSALARFPRPSPASFHSSPSSSSITRCWLPTQSQQQGNGKNDRCVLAARGEGSEVGIELPLDSAVTPGPPRWESPGVSQMLRSCRSIPMRRKCSAIFNSNGKLMKAFMRENDSSLVLPFE